METISAKILGDVISICLAIFGIGVTVFTVIYSFILTRKGILQEYNDIIKKHEASPQVEAARMFLLKYIKCQQKVNKHIGAVTIISFIIFAVSLFLSYTGYAFQNSVVYTKYVDYITYYLAAICLALLVYIIVMLIIVYKTYRKDCKINGSN